MAHSDDDTEKQWTWKQKLMYGLLGLGALLLLGGVAWYVYGMYSGPQTPSLRPPRSFKSPESISIAVKKSE